MKRVDCFSITLLKSLGDFFLFPCTFCYIASYRENMCFPSSYSVALLFIVLSSYTACMFPLVNFTKETCMWISLNQIVKPAIFHTLRILKSLKRILSNNSKFIHPYMFYYGQACYFLFNNNCLITTIVYYARALVALMHIEVL